MVSRLGDVRRGAGVRRAAAAGLLLTLCTILAYSKAGANDTAAELATGGLLLTKSAGIEMRAEDLYVSPRQIRVGYRFYNTAPADVSTVVVFPMPEVAVSDAAADIPLPTDDPQNLLGFSTRVDGAPVRARVVQKAVVRGVDRTADLDRLKVPLAPHLRSTDKALTRLPPGDWEEIKRLGLAEVEEYSVGRGMRKQLSPRWMLTTTYFWEQTFPAGKEVAIEHSYKPSVGTSAQTALGNPEAMQQARFEEYRRKYCIDQDFMAAVARARQSVRSQDGAPFSEERISYLLSTGASSAQPIGEFRLVVDKGDPSNLVSFCAEGVRRISPTRFEVRKTGFSPTSDLHVLILKPLKRR
jgi:hypothetical protein